MMGQHRSSRSDGTTQVYTGARRALVAACLTLLFVGLGAAQASAQGVGMAAIPNPTSDENTDVLNPVTVGQADFPYELSLENRSSAAVGPLAVDAQSIFLTPSCGTIPLGGAPPCVDLDPGLFSFSATGVGASAPGKTGDPSCVGTVFDIVAVNDAAGRIRFDPRTPLTLGTGGTDQSSCVIHFTATVLKAPSKDADTGSAGIQTGALGEIRGTQAQGTLKGSGAGSAEQTVNKARPTIRTAATPSATAGGSIGDNATVESLVNPVAGATVTFVLYSDAGCTAEVYRSADRPVSLSGSTGTADAVAFANVAGGTYYWRAFYSGDANNNAVSGACGAANETSTVTVPPGTPPCTPPPGPTPLPPGTVLCTPPPCLTPPATTPLLPGQVLCTEVRPAAVAAAKEVPAGTARIAGVSGCATRNFNVTVSGHQIRRVVFSLDGKRIKTLTRPNSGSRYALAVKPNSLRRGTHRIAATTTFTAKSKTKSRTLRVVFQRCARAAVSPAFTG